MVSKRLSRTEFKLFIHALFANDKLEVKYQNPNAWRGYKLL